MKTTDNYKSIFNPDFENEVLLLLESEHLIEHIHQRVDRIYEWFQENRKQIMQEQ